MDAVPLLMPQVNVNDDTVLLVRWSVPQNACVSAGEVVCEVETSKATSEVIADRSGVLVQSAVVGTRIRIGDPIGVIAASAEAGAARLAAAASAPAAPGARDGGGVKATPKAQALADAHGLDLATLAPSARGTIKEGDVRAFIAAREGGAPAAPAAPNRYVDRVGPISAFDAAVAANLRLSTSHAILTSVDMDCRVAQVHTRLQRLLAAGKMASLLHAVIAAAARALPAHPRLMSVAHQGSLYQYRAVDVAFVARTADGRLYTPVVRGADRMDLEAIASACQAATLRVMRGAIKADELEGACFTVSHVPVPGTTRVVALPNAGQSAVLAVSAEHSKLELVEGSVVATPAVTLTLTYDHALCDGVYAASYLAATVGELEAPAR